MGGLDKLLVKNVKFRVVPGAIKEITICREDLVETYSVSLNRNAQVGLTNYWTVRPVWILLAATKQSTQLAERYPESHLRLPTMGLITYSSLHTCTIRKHIAEQLGLMKRR